jgi:hypothetical protein
LNFRTSKRNGYSFTLWCCVYYWCWGTTLFGEWNLCGRTFPDLHSKFGVFVRSISYKNWRGAGATNIFLGKKKWSYYTIGSDSGKAYCVLKRKVAKMGGHPRENFFSNLPRILKKKCRQSSQLAERFKVSTISWGSRGFIYGRVAKVTDLQFIGSGSNPATNFFTDHKMIVKCFKGRNRDMQKFSWNLEKKIETEYEPEPINCKSVTLRSAMG